MEVNFVYLTRVSGSTSNTHNKTKIELSLNYITVQLEGVQSVKNILKNSELRLNMSS